MVNKALLNIEANSDCKSSLFSSIPESESKAQEIPVQEVVYEATEESVPPDESGPCEQYKPR